MSELPNLLHGAIRSRQYRTKQFFEFVEKNGRNYEKTQLLALYSIHEGITRQTLLSYLQEYLDAKLIKEYGDRIVTAAQYLELIETDSERAHELSGDGGN